MLNKHEVLGIAALAKLELSEKELTVFGKQLSDILDLFKEIDDIDVEGVIETSQVTGIENIAFEDCVIETEGINPTGSKKNFTGNIPLRDGDKIIVPAVIQK